jgi:hypothetical protein
VPVIKLLLKLFLHFGFVETDIGIKISVGVPVLLRPELNFGAMVFSCDSVVSCFTCAGQVFERLSTGS